MDFAMDDQDAMYLDMADVEVDIESVKFAKNCLKQVRPGQKIGVLNYTAYYKPDRSLRVEASFTVGPVVDKADYDCNSLGECHAWVKQWEGLERKKLIL